jgi:hypothetical protein
VAGTDAAGAGLGAARAAGLAGPAAGGLGTVAGGGLGVAGRGALGDAVGCCAGAGKVRANIVAAIAPTATPRACAANSEAFR